MADESPAAHNPKAPLRPSTLEELFRGAFDSSLSAIRVRIVGGATAETTTSTTTTTTTSTSTSTTQT